MGQVTFIKKEIQREKESTFINCSREWLSTILNLSIHDENKKIVTDAPEAIPLLIKAMKKGSMETRSNSAATLFTLSALDVNKVKIGEAGAISPPVELLDQGSSMAKKDAAVAIFNLCIMHDNRARAVRDGAVLDSAHIFLIFSSKNPT
ncbi:U-box domain-containing protein 9 [Nymphaea thermarum]|nr:U-box domain-containing protein 9 [Nymphaea thermarum]